MFGLIALGVVVCLSLSLAGDRGRTAAAAAAPAVLASPRQETVSAAPAAVGRTVIPLGKAVGIKLFSDGVLVVGLSPVETGEGASYPGRDCGLKAGDVITHINGGEVDTIEEVQALVKEWEDEPLTIQAVRGQRQLQLTAAAVENSQGVYQLGVWPFTTRPAASLARWATVSMTWTPPCSCPWSRAASCRPVCQR